MLDRLDIVPSSGQALVLQLLHARLYSSNLKKLECDLQVWEDALSFSITQRVTLILYDYIKSKNHICPSTLIDQMKRIYRNNAINNIRFEKELLFIKQNFYKAGIPLVVLKGIILSNILYEDPAIRPSVDLDLFIPRQNFLQAREILADLGYSWPYNWRPLKERAYLRQSHHVPLYNYKKHIIVELHQNFLPKSRSGLINTNIIWNQLKTINFVGDTFFMFHNEDLFLYLTLHSAMEYWRTLLHIYDMATLIIVAQNFDWSLLIQRANSWHCEKRLLVSCSLIHKLFEVPLPELVLEMIKKNIKIEKITNTIISEMMDDNSKKDDLLSKPVLFDMLLSDRCRDRLSILFYKSNNRISKILSKSFKLQKIPALLMQLY